MTNSYKDLIVWQKAIKLVNDIYVLTLSLPKNQYSLVNQIERAAVSIPANIAEGKFRQSDAQFKYFLSIAYASAAELDTLLIIARNIEFISPPKSKMKS